MRGGTGWTELRAAGPAARPDRRLPQRRPAVRPGPGCAAAADRGRGALAWPAGRRLRLLEESADEDLTGLFDDGLLRQLLDQRIPAGHWQSRRLGLFRQARFRNGDVIPRVQPRRPFTLDMISASLAGISATAAPDPGQFRRIGRALAGRSDEDIIGRLPRLDPVQRSRARWWLRHVGGPARLVQRARGIPQRRPGSDHGRR